MGSPMSVISTHDQIYSNLLSSRYDLSRLYDQDISLAEEPDFYRILMSDMKFSGIVRQLYYEVAASGYQLQPGSRSRTSHLKSRILTSMLKKSNLSEGILGLCKGIMMARAYAYPEGRGVIASHCGTLPQEWWTVTDLKDIDKQRISLFSRKLWVNKNGQIAGNQMGFNVVGGNGKVAEDVIGDLGQKVKDGMVVGPDRDSEGGYQIFTRRYLSDPANTGQYKPMSKEYAAALIELVISDEEARLGMGLGLAEAAYLGLRAKAIVLKAGLKGVTKWAEELLVGMINPDRPASKGKKNLNLAQDLLTKLANMREGNVMVVPEGLVDIKSIASTGTGHQMVMEMMNYIDESFRECCGLAIPGGIEVQRTGSGAKLGRQATNKAVQHHRNMIAACLNRTLIPTLCRLNRQQFEAAFEAEGMIDDSEDPVLVIVDDAQNDPEKMTERIEKAQAMNIDIPLEWAHQSMQIPMASDGEPLLAAATPEPAPFGGGGPPGASDQNPDSPDSPNSATPGDKFADQKENQDHQDGEAAQKQGERANPASKSYAARRDLSGASTDDLIAECVRRLESSKNNKKQERA